MTVIPAARRVPKPTIYWRFNRFLERHLPAGLYQRSLIILIAPLVLLQSIMAGIILDRHWDNVTKVLARSLAREVGLITTLYERSDKSPAALADLEKLANSTLNLSLTIQQNTRLPEPVVPPLFSLVDTKLAKYLTSEIGKPFWIDSVGQTGRVDIRVEAEDGLVFRIMPSEERAYAANTDALLMWMVISSLILASIAVLFLRNQITPILDLARAARSFGLGRDVGDFHPKGAREVREAAQAFLNMKDRIERHVEQRTAMLAGVSHDLRTVLTRFKLELAFLGDGPQIQPLKEDVQEMQHMLEAYMAFVRGDGGERAEPTDVAQLLRSVSAAIGRGTKPVSVEVADELTLRVKPNAFRRLMANLIGNAAHYGKMVKVAAVSDMSRLRVTVDDDGPGIPPDLREDAFRPFVRLDQARNQDETGTGLGLAVARDIARAHGGEISLDHSPLGGLRAVVEIPL